jgi:hypothetical protein
MPVKGVSSFGPVNDEAGYGVVAVDADHGFSTRNAWRLLAPTQAH